MAHTGRPGISTMDQPVNMRNRPSNYNREPELDLGVSEAVAFLREIGIPVEVVPAVSEASFLESVEIVAGALHITPACSVSNLLHEAGHIACVPAPYRTFLSGNLNKGLRTMFESISALDLDLIHR